MYTNISSCVTNNGWTSQYFDVNRGVRQGCPLSPYLFILAAETLAINIRQNSKIKGVKIGDKEFKIKLYADDTQIVTIFDSESMKEIGLTFDKFSKISGLTVNYSKSNILRIGALKNSQDKLPTEQNFVWTNGPLNILGIKITSDGKNLTSINLTPVISKMNNIIKIWSKRKFTLFGKITIINSLLSSQLVYKLSVLPSPTKKELKDIDKMLLNYLWNNKPPKISKSILLAQTCKGGIQMVDISTKNNSLKISWIKRILNSAKFAISPVLDFYSKIDTKLLLECNLQETDITQCFEKKYHLFGMMY